MERLKQSRQIFHIWPYIKKFRPPLLLPQWPQFFLYCLHTVYTMHIEGFVILSYWHLYLKWENEPFSGQTSLEYESLGVINKPCWHMRGSRATKCPYKSTLMQALFIKMINNRWLKNLQKAVYVVNVCPIAPYKIAHLVFIILNYNKN